MNNITDKLFKLQDKKYQELQYKIIPNVDNIIGVRTPELRKLAKKLVKENNYKSFLEELPHKYFDENQVETTLAALTGEAPTHSYSETWESDGTNHWHECECGAKSEEAAHTYSNGKCSGCQKDFDDFDVVASFEFGNNSDSTHKDGSEITQNASFNSFNDAYTLNIIPITKVYSSAFDEKGNSCLKLGTGSVIAEFYFTVPENVDRIIVYAAKYKDNDSELVINGKHYTLTKNSNDGEYDEIVVETSIVKTITIATVSNKCRAMINTIVFYTTNCEHIPGAPATCTTTQKCTVCGAEIAATLDHDMQETVAAVEPTCEEDGCTQGVKCRDCGYEIKSEVVEATGHTYVDGTCKCGATDPNYGGETPDTPTSNRYYIATIRTSGNYFYMTSDLGTASTKRYTAVDSGSTTLPTSTTPKDGYVFVLIDNGDGTYSIQAEGVEVDNYLGWTSGNSGTLVAQANAIKFTLDVNDGIYNIHFAASDAERYLALNATSGNNYFAWYKSGQKQDLVLIPVVESGESGGETPAPECTHTNTTETTTATCTAAGTTTVTCNDCGKVISTTETAALGHTTTSGTCERCGDTIGGSTTEPTVVLEITVDDFNTTSYTANNNTKTEGDYSYTSYQVMKQSSTMQWQKSKGYITIASNEFVKLEMKVTAATFTVTVGGTTVTGTTSNGVTTYDLSGKTGEVKISVGSATGKVEYIKFYK